MTLPDTLRYLSLSALDPRSDGELVADFVGTREEGAFAELLRRHGPTVYGVCRRIVGDGPDADDAFQAVFLVLARKANTIRPPGMVGNWLYGVAVRTANKARVMNARRMKREQRSSLPQASNTGERDPETLALIDAELAALPAVYRAAFVACDLNGRSRSEAARELGWPEGTVAARLAKARELLAARLRKRGVTLGATTFAAVTVPTAVSAETLLAVRELLAVGTASAVVSAAQQLSDEVANTMGTFKLKLAAIVCLAIAIAGGTAAIVAGPGERPGPRSERQPMVNAPVPKEKVSDPLIAVWQGDDVRILTADGKEVHKLAFKEWNDRGGGFIRLSPDGKRIAVRLSDKGNSWKLIIATLGNHKPDLVVELEKTGDGLFWSPDGTTVSCGEDGKLVTVDADTGKKTTAEPEYGTRVYGITADGRKLAEYLTYSDTLQPTRKLGFLNAKLADFKPFLELIQTDVEVPGYGHSPLGVSADGSFAAFARGLRDNKNATNSNVVEWIDIAKGDRKVLFTLPAWEITPSKLAMSPNGEWVAVGYQEREAVLPGKFAPSLGFTLALYDRTTGKPTNLLERNPGRIKAVDVWSPRQIKAPAPKAVEAWGEAKGGLQAGLRMPAGVTVEQGEVAAVHLVVRNVGDEAKEITFWKRVEPSNTIEGLLSWEGGKENKYDLQFRTYLSGRPPEETTFRLNPQEEIVLWRTGICHGPTTGKPPEGLDFQQLFPTGTSRLTASGTGAKAGAELLATGELEVRLPEPKRNAPVPKAPEWKEAKPIELDGGRITCVAYSPSGKTLAVCRDTGKIDFYDPATRKHITTINVAGEKGTTVATVTALAFAPTPHPKHGDLFAVTHNHGVKFGTVGLGIFTDDAQKVEGIPVNWILKDCDPNQLVWSGDTSLVATNGAKLEWRWRLEGKNDKLDFNWELPGGKQAGQTVLAAIPGHDGFILTNGNNIKDPNEVEIAVPPPASSPQLRLPGHKSRPIAAAVSKDGQRIVTADAGGTLIVWEGGKLAFKEKSRVELGEGVAQLTLAPDGKTVAALRVYGVAWLGKPADRISEIFQLFVFDSTDPPAKPTAIWSNDARSLPGNRNGPGSLAFSPDGNTLLAAFADPYTDDAKLYGPIPKSMGVKVWELIPKK